MPIQVIKESQRLFPAAAIGPIRFAAENAELGGYFIPKGTRVQVCRKRHILSRAYTPCYAVRETAMHDERGLQHADVIIPP